jgi:biofilm PGA synthesis N-glycosyltransferase PgaC
MSAATAIGIMAYNEERNIGSLLESILSQAQGDNISRVVVVASGCTDRTCEIVSEFTQRDSRVTLIEEPNRAGKTAAVNRFLLTASEEILTVSSADLIFQPQTILELLRPFADPEIGMVGAHAVPRNANDNFFGYASNLMWTLHHEISLRDPKMGELIAFRNVFRRLNPAAISDELSVYQLMRSAGYKVAYAPAAIVYNKGPGTLSDFISPRCERCPSCVQHYPTRSETGVDCTGRLGQACSSFTAASRASLFIAPNAGASNCRCGNP